MLQIIVREKPLVSLPFGCRSVGHCVYEHGEGVQDSGLANEFVQLVWGVAGLGEITLFGQHFSVSPGSVVYWLPGEEHSFKSISHQWEYRWCTFDGPLACATILAYNYPRFIENAGPCPVSLFQEMAKYLPQDEPHVMRHLSALVSELLARAGGCGGQEPASQIVRKFVDIVRRQYSDPSMNVESIAMKLGVHRSTLCRLVTRQLGHSPHDFLSSNRAQHALSLLKGTDFTISEIARQTGLPNLAHFYAVIRHCVGMSPTEYREKERAMAMQGTTSGRQQAAPKADEEV